LLISGKKGVFAFFFPHLGKYYRLIGGMETAGYRGLKPDGGLSQNRPPKAG